MQSCKEDIQHFPDCKKNIESHSAEYIANDYGTSAAWVLNNIKIKLWSKPTHLGKGQVVGQMYPHSRAVILDETENDYKVRSPLDK